MKTHKPKLLEKDLQKQIIDLGHLYGWRIAHFRPALRQSGHYSTPVGADGAGWPDLTLVKGRRLIFAEIKAQDGKTSTEQDIWLDCLEKTGATVFIWKPSDWDDIQRVLTQ
jgi:hypothetical protein